MTQTQINEIKMYEAINDYLNRYPEVWASVKVIGNYKNQLWMIVLQILKLGGENISNKHKVKGAVQTLKMQLADKLDLLDDIMETYASDIGDKKLQKLSTNSHADYISLPNDRFEKKVRLVIGLLEKHVAEMSDYGINSAQIEDAKLCFNDFLRRIGRPFSYPIDTLTVSKDLDGLFREADIYVHKLDNVMHRFRRSSVQFFIGYQAARKIIHF